MGITTRRCGVNQQRCTEGARERNIGRERERGQRERARERERGNREREREREREAER